LHNEACLLATLAQGKQLFEARVQALAKTHQRLTNSNVDAVRLDEIVRSELEIFSSRTSIQGDPIFLRYEQAQRFALAIHELATNALKYGALSAPSGVFYLKRCSWGSALSIRPTDFVANSSPD
jgi:two-component sensor histidine kinase